MYLHRHLPQLCLSFLLKVLKMLFVMQCAKVLHQSWPFSDLEIVLVPKLPHLKQSLFSCWLIVLFSCSYFETHGIRDKPAHAKQGQKNYLKQLLSFFMNVVDFNTEKGMVCVGHTQFKVLSSFLLSSVFKVQKDRLDVSSLGCISTSSYPLVEDNSSLHREQAPLGLGLYQFFWKRTYLGIHIWELKIVQMKLYLPTTPIL